MMLAAVARGRPAARACCRVFPRSATTHPDRRRGRRSLIGLGWCVIAPSGGYQRRRLRRRRRRVQAGPQRHRSSPPGWSASAATSPSTSCPAGFFVFAFVVGVPLLILGRFVLRRRSSAPAPRRTCRHRVVIAGTPAAHRRDRPRAAARVVARLRGGRRPDPAHRRPRGDRRRACRCSGQRRRRRPWSRTLATPTWSSSPAARIDVGRARCASWCGTLEEHDVQVVVAPSVTDISSERVRIRPVGGLPLMHIDPPRVRCTRPSWGKRALRRRRRARAPAAASPGPRWSPRSGSRPHDGGPILFRQTRIGRDGERVRLPQVPHHGGRRRGPARRRSTPRSGTRRALFKMKDDPRITKPGPLAAPLLRRRAAPAVSTCSAAT